MTPSGRGVDPDRLDTFWQMIREGTEHCTTGQARSLFLDLSHFDVLAARVEDFEWDVSLQTILDTARNLRSVADHPQAPAPNPAPTPPNTAGFDPPRATPLARALDTARDLSEYAALDHPHERSRADLQSRQI